MDLRIRRLGVRIPPGAPVFSLVKAFFLRLARVRVRCGRALGAIAGAIGAVRFRFMLDHWVPVAA